MSNHIYQHIIFGINELLKLLNFPFSDSKVDAEMFARKFSLKGWKLPQTDSQFHYFSQDDMICHSV